MHRILRRSIGYFLIFTLAFFTGSVCVHPMAAEAVADYSDMHMAGMVNPDSEGILYSVGNSTGLFVVESGAVQPCAAGCVSDTPDATLGKKVSDVLPTFAPMMASFASRTMESGTANKILSSCGSAPPSDTLLTVSQKE